MPLILKKDSLIGEKVQLFDELVAINENTFVSSKINENVAA